MKFYHAVLFIVGFATSAMAAEPDEINRLKAQAEAGDSEAQFRLGEVFDEAVYNGPEALKWYEKAAEQGHPKALDRVCRFYMSGRDQLTKGMPWCQKAADKNVPFGMAVIGGALAKGAGGLKEDGLKALDYLERGSAAGEVEAITELGDMYKSGKFVPQDYKRSAELYRKAMAKGSTIGAASLAEQYELGWGVPAEPAEAGRLYFLSAVGGFSVARNWLRNHPEINEESLAARRMVWVSPDAATLMDVNEETGAQAKDQSVRDELLQRLNGTQIADTAQQSKTFEAAIECHWNDTGVMDNCLLLVEKPQIGVGSTLIELATQPFLSQGSSNWATEVAGRSVRLLLRRYLPDEALYAYRDQGNYHAGEQGQAAEAVHTGEQPFCYSNGTCPPNYLYRDYVKLNGRANYRAGEEVLNSELRTESWLTKMTSRFGDGNTLQLGYTGYRSEAGDRLASRLGSSTAQAVQQAQTAGILLDTYTARYRWNPSDNDLINLKSNVYWSHLELRNTVRGGRGVKPVDLGLPADFRVGSDTDMWGADVSNRSKFFTAHGDIDLTYGVSARAEDTRGSRHTAVLEGWTTPRDGFRQEVAGFAKSAWSPADWATLNAGLRYTHYWSKDRFDPYERTQANYAPIGFKSSADGFSPSLGVTFKPTDDAQIFINYARTLRMPSLMESVSAFNSVIAQTGLKPERTDGWEIGANLVHKGLLGDSDQGMFKLTYFNWDVKDYLARDVIVTPTITLNINNIPSAKLAGLELSSRYENDGFVADFGATVKANRPNSDSLIEAFLLELAQS